ncbi:unnamed protein product [Orchesella dallaii]|uniref:C-type lectin domain-containing protein n=1 Tax=Orchesella dallaii TaxID=48710 RepID=A0ABP1Q745_9HEXA
MNYEIGSIIGSGIMQCFLTLNLTFMNLILAQWDEGKRDCVNKGYIGLAETHKEDELYLIKRILDDNADIAEQAYWVGASARKFKWIATKKFVGNWLEDVWEDGYRGTILNAQTALQLKFTRDAGWRFRTGVTSHNARYLCEE